MYRARAPNFFNSDCVAALVSADYVCESQTKRERRLLEWVGGSVGWPGPTGERKMCACDIASNSLTQITPIT